MRLGLAALALALVPTAFECESEPTPRQALESERVAEPVDALSRRLGRARQRLRERGYQETGLSFRLFLPADTGQAETVRIRRGVCTTFLALAGGSVRELELTLYDADGRRAAVDSVVGEGSLVHACPRPAEPPGRSDALYYLKALAKGGAGAVAVRAFESPIGSAAGVEGIFDGILAPLDRGRGVETLVGRTIERLRSRAMVPIGAPLVARVLEGEALRRAETLEEGQCYVAIARGEETVRDVALYLVDPAGVEVARDLVGRTEPRIEHCASQSGRYVVEALAAEGSGDIGIALVLDPNAHPEVADAPAAPEAQGPADDSVVATPDAVAKLVARGYHSPRYLVRASVIRSGETVTHDLVLGAGCSVLLVAPESSEMDLDLYLAGLEDGERWSDTRITSEARLATCRDHAEPARATVKAYGAEGTYALVALEAPAGATDVRHLRILEAAGPFLERGYALDRTVELSLAQGEEHVVPVDVRAGTCFLAAAAGGRGLDDVDLALRSEDGRVLASDTGPDAWASVNRCVDEAARIELRVVAYRGRGSILVQQMRRTR